MTDEAKVKKVKKEEELPPKELPPVGSAARKALVLKGELKE